MTKYSGHFRNTQWDPFLLISQIIAVQCLYYVSFGLWLSIIGLFTGDTRSLDPMFKYQDLNIRDYYGVSVIVAIIFNAITGSFILWTLTQRTKLCLDFSCTLHFIHILFCTYYNNAFPGSILWWIVYIFSCTIMCILGEILCMRTELKAIPLNMTPKVHL
uniref:Protein SYS1 homolog n=1 Tax=Cacopsylla melanoneura TaxID=428564 RepID=A0A8D8W9E0_9HEMI